MKTILANLIGSICFWVWALFTIFTLLEAALTLFACLMVLFDHGYPAQDHDWAPAVVIHGFAFVVFGGIALSCFMVARLFLRTNWWSVPLLRDTDPRLAQATAVIGAIMVISGFAFPMLFPFAPSSVDIRLVRFATPACFALIGLCLSISGSISLMLRNRKVP